MRSRKKTGAFDVRCHYDLDHKLGNGYVPEEVNFIVDLKELR